MDIRQSPRIVAIGGGAGLSRVLEGLKRHSNQLTAIVSPFGSGGWSGETGCMPSEDLRQCLLALSSAGEVARELRLRMEGRSPEGGFEREVRQTRHFRGVLPLSDLVNLRGVVADAVEGVGRNIDTEVLPATLNAVELRAELEDGTRVSGVAAEELEARDGRCIRTLFLGPDTVTANLRAVDAILKADAVVIGPGDLYTAVLPVLLLRGIPEALAGTRAVRIFVCNLMTKRGETEGFRAPDFVREIVHYLGGPHLDWVLANAQELPMAARALYAQAGACPVEPDLQPTTEGIGWFFGASLAVADGAGRVRHDPEGLALGLINLLHRAPGHTRRVS